jgi:hypothetical protein
MDEEQIRIIMQLLAALIWKFGKADIDENEIEIHTVKLDEDDVLLYFEMSAEYKIEDGRKVGYFCVKGSK